MDWILDLTPACPCFVEDRLSALFLGSLSATAALAALAAEPLAVQPFRKHSSSPSGIQGFGHIKTKITQESVPARPWPGLFLSLGCVSLRRLNVQNPSTRFPRGQLSFPMCLEPSSIFSGECNQYPFRIC